MFGPEQVAEHRLYKVTPIIKNAPLIDGF